MHYRQTIRNKIVSLLTGNTDAASDVFASRIYPVDKGLAAAILVYTNEEEAENSTTMQGLILKD